MRHAHWLGLGLLAAASLGLEHAKPAVQAAEPPRPRALLGRLLLGEATAGPVVPAVHRDQIVLRPGVTLRFTTVEPTWVRRQG